jgi:hypothetical protein
MDLSFRKKLPAELEITGTLEVEVLRASLSDALRMTIPAVSASCC